MDTTTDVPSADLIPDGWFIASQLGDRMLEWGTTPHRFDLEPKVYGDSVRQSELDLVVEASARRRGCDDGEVYD
jgi:hypothetical protein